MPMTPLSGEKTARAQNIENDLWKIEKQVKADGTIPQENRDRFVKYVEDKLDQIKDKY